MARAMIRLAGSVAVLADSSKSGKLAPFTVAGFDSIDCMVCDEAPDGQLRHSWPGNGLRSSAETG